jgi:hypothetical protein
MSKGRQALRGDSRRIGDARRRAAVLASALVLTALALGSSAGTSNARAAAAPTPAPVAAPTPVPAGVTIGPTVRGRPMPSGFVGLSLEYRALLTYLGSDPSALNPVFLRLLRNLNPGQSPILRIGGDSTDWTWWPVADMKQPRGITYDITPAWLAVAKALAQQTNARYILGINLEANSRVIETDESHALMAGIGRRYIDALELGNEPELYSKLGWYRSGNTFVPGRPPSFDFTGFTNEFSQFRHELFPVPTAGPSTGSYWWLTHLSQFLADEPSLGVVTVHSYWLDKCLHHPTLPGYPTVPNLLNPHPPSRMVRNLPEFTALAHAHGMPLRIDEMNSVTCGGAHGVSDVFASALWAVNALFEAMSDGVDGVNIHTFPGTANQLFGFTDAAGQWSASVRPEYYGLLMFEQAAPPGAKLLTIGQLHTGQTRVWATLGNRGIVRIVLINDSLTEPSSVVVAAPTPGASAQVERLQAPSPYATSAITLGGQSFGAETTTGTLTGPTSTVVLAPVANTATTADYAVSLPAASAAMLTIVPHR